MNFHRGVPGCRGFFTVRTSPRVERRLFESSSASSTRKKSDALGFSACPKAKAYPVCPPPPAVSRIFIQLSPEMLNASGAPLLGRLYLSDGCELQMLLNELVIDDPASISAQPIAGKQRHLQPVILSHELDGICPTDIWTKPIFRANTLLSAFSQEQNALTIRLADKHPDCVRFSSHDFG